MILTLCRPAPYLLGAKRLGVDPAKCKRHYQTILSAHRNSVVGLVVEDAPAGVRSGHAASCKTLGVITSHSREVMEAVAPTFLVDKLDRQVGPRAFILWHGLICTHKQCHHDCYQRRRRGDHYNSVEYAYKSMKMDSQEQEIIHLDIDMNNQHGYAQQTIEVIERARTS